MDYEFMDLGASLNIWWNALFVSRSSNDLPSLGIRTFVGWSHEDPKISLQISVENWYLKTMIRSIISLQKQSHLQKRWSSPKLTCVNKTAGLLVLKTRTTKHSGEGEAGWAKYAPNQCTTLRPLWFGATSADRAQINANRKPNKKHIDCIVHHRTMLWYA